MQPWQRGLLLIRSLLIWTLCMQVVVVANPANTNALILKENAPSIPAKNISALTRLDHNRALGQVLTWAPSLNPGRTRARLPCSCHACVCLTPCCSSAAPSIYVVLFVGCSCMLSITHAVGSGKVVASPATPGLGPVTLLLAQWVQPRCLLCSRPCWPQTATLLQARPQSEALETASICLLSRVHLRRCQSAWVCQSQRSRT